MCADLKSAGARERKFTSPRTFSSSSSHDHRADCCNVVDETMSLEFAPVVGLFARQAIGSVWGRQPLSRRISYFKSEVSDRSDLSDRRCGSRLTTDSKARSGKYKIPPSGGIKRYLACRAGGTTKGITASSPESGAISHSRAGFASEKRVECTPVLDTSGERRKARSGKTLNTAVRRNQTLPSACRASARRQAQTPATPESGAISHSRAGFASEKRVECTPVLDTSGERRKARSGKARSLRHLSNLIRGSASI